MNIKTLLPIVFSCLAAGCVPKDIPNPPEDGIDFEALRNPISSQPIPTKGVLQFDRTLLPQGARGRFSSFDGDAFVINLPRRLSGELNSEAVLTEIVGPLANGMGYDRAVRDLAPGSATGLKMPQADLSSLANATCAEVADEKYKRFHPVCEALRSNETNPVAERVFKLAYGMTAAQFRADIERPRIQYVFTQRANQLPIEHVGLIAERNDGEHITLVYGTLLNHYGITNDIKLSAREAVEAGRSQISKFEGISDKRIPTDDAMSPVLVLLPYGSAPDGSIGLKYAYRALILALAEDDPSGTFLSWMAWIDAEDGTLLELAPQFDEVSALGQRWRRDPSTPLETRSFQVDAATGGQYTLQRAGVLNRIDRLGDGDFDDEEVSISDSMGGSSATFANFNQAPLNEGANAICAAGGNNTFRQVNAFSHLSRFRDMLVWSGVYHSGPGPFPTFPVSPITTRLDLNQSGNSAGYDSLGVGQSVLKFGTGGMGFTNAACPNVANGVLSGSNDTTGLTHEMMHLGTKRLQERRPTDWCGMAGCMMPNSGPRLAFHDYTDSWAHAYASTPCMAGWYRKNMGGADVSLHCASHSEGGSLPRLASVEEPFDPATPLDHFPERRATLTGGYQDMQIIGSALWYTRQGMRSKCLPSGTPQFWNRINLALYKSGFITNTCTNCDRDIYRYAQNFLDQLAWQWANAGAAGGPPGFAHNGAHSTNKLLSAWAKTGIFLIPDVCIDGDAATGNPTFCPVASGGENGGDAIGDVFDNDATDDIVIDNVTHVEMDWIERGGPVPTLRVWTGPRYQFDASGSASGYTPSAATPAPCNTKFRVELASDDAFTAGVVNGPWIDVSTTADPACYGTWEPDAADWAALGGATGDVKVYYRIRTRDAADGNEKLSTSPGSGSYGVPPSYVVVNDAGQP